MLEQLPENICPDVLDFRIDDQRHQIGIWGEIDFCSANFQSDSGF
jgi:hypothetical protein